MRKNGKPARMRRAAAILAAVLGTAVIVSGCGSTGPGKGDGSVRIGVSLYDQYDTFISELMASFNSYVDGRKSEGVEIATIVQDASRSQPAQNEDVAEMIENGCNVLCVNLVDRTAPTEIIDTARKNNIPVIFFNRELVEEDLMQWDKLYCSTMSERTRFSQAPSRARWPQSISRHIPRRTETEMAVSSM